MVNTVFRLLGDIPLRSLGILGLHDLFLTVSDLLGDLECDLDLCLIGDLCLTGDLDLELELDDLDLDLLLYQRPREGDLL